VGRVSLHLHDLIEIGENVVINDGVVIFTGSHDVDSATFEATIRPVRIGDFAWIATNAMILPGVSIGKGAVVGAGSVVTRDVAPYQVVAGNPAQVVRRNRSCDLRYKPVEFLAPYEAWRQPQP